MWGESGVQLEQGGKKTIQRRGRREAGGGLRQLMAA